MDSSPAEPAWRLGRTTSPLISWLPTRRRSGRQGKRCPRSSAARFPLGAPDLRGTVAPQSTKAGSCRTQTNLRHGHENRLSGRPSAGAIGERPTRCNAPARQRDRIRLRESQPESLSIYSPTVFVAKASRQPYAPWVRYGSIVFSAIEPSADYGGTRSRPTLRLYLGFTLDSAATWLLAWIVGRIHVGYRKRALTVYLDHRVL